MELRDGSLKLADLVPVVQRLREKQEQLDYTPQLPEGLMSKETFLVLPIVHVGGRYWI
ncbi:hypothetical protein ACFLUK_02585 [Chloroflexota bacterium]